MQFPTVCCKQQGYFELDCSLIYGEGTHSTAVLDTGDGDCHLVWYISDSGVVSVGICMHVVLGIDPLYV